MQLSLSYQINNKNITKWPELLKSLKWTTKTLPLNCQNCRIISIQLIVDFSTKGFWLTNVSPIDAVGEGTKTRHGVKFLYIALMLPIKTEDVDWYTLIE